MRRNLIAAAAVALIAGSAALAQETGAGGASSMDWSGPIGQALFTDETMTTARSGEELQSNWQNLGQEEQQQVRAHCQSMQTQMGLGGGDAGAGGAGGGATTGGATDMTTAGGAGGATTGGATGGATGAGTDMTTAGGAGGATGETGATGTGAGTDMTTAGGTAGTAGGATGTGAGTDMTTAGASEMPTAGATGGTAGQPGTQQLASLCSEIQGF